MEAVLIFPHQVFEFHPCLKINRPVLLIEDEMCFSRFRFHKQKIVFHRATLKNFEKLLIERGYKTCYIEENLEKHIQKMKILKLFITEFDDFELEEKILSIVKRNKIHLEIVPSPSFMAAAADFQEIFKSKKQFRCDTFYIHQRKNFEILLENDGKPMGGKWSFDTENRKHLPKHLVIPKTPLYTQTDVIKEAILYVEKKHPQNPGESRYFNYPTTHQCAKKALQDFLDNRLCLFGDYEDAIVAKESVLFHSCLSPLLNVGLLTPNQVIEETINYSKEHQIPLNNIEGFIRQVLGWREFVRGVYHAIGKKQREKNFFHHKRKLPQAFYEASTGILPIDETIKKLQKHAYLHHIERLMILGNFLLLCEIDPEDIYRWFMEMFIDAYDWVMVPNVYGMSQYADGGMMTTKPYFSGSNYLLKMSDYPKGSWCKVWDALFWRFMIKHHKFFESQPRLMMLCKMAREKNKDEELLAIAENFLKGFV